VSLGGVPGVVELVGDPLAPLGGGAWVGYARVSSTDQLLRCQVDALTRAGCIRVFKEKLSGKTAECPPPWACLDYLREGDTLVVLDRSRLGRSLTDLPALVGRLRRRGIGFTSLHEDLDTTTPGAG
jgi:DNA invertase Pin-like site-specific DNA recombinase